MSKDNDLDNLLYKYDQEAIKNDFSKIFPVKNFVGFEDFIDTIINIRSHNNYPPYNIEKINDENFLIVIAVAGFCKSNIKIKLEGYKLLIIGEQNNTKDKEYIYKGIAERSFERSFILSNNMKVKECKIESGLLKIYLYKPEINIKIEEIPIL